MKINVHGREEFEMALAELTLAGRGWSSIEIGDSPATYVIHAGPTMDEFLLGDLALQNETLTSHRTSGKTGTGCPGKSHSNAYARK